MAKDEAPDKYVLAAYLANLNNVILSLDKTGQEYHKSKTIFSEEFRTICGELSKVINYE